MRVFNQTEKAAFAQRFPQRPAKTTGLWYLHYGSNTQPWFGPAPYSHCVVEKQRLMKAGLGYKEELFKIK